MIDKYKNVKEMMARKREVNKKEKPKSLLSIVSELLHLVELVSTEKDFLLRWGKVKNLKK